MGFPKRDNLKNTSASIIKALFPQAFLKRNLYVAEISIEPLFLIVYVALKYC